MFLSEENGHIKHENIVFRRDVPHIVYRCPTMNFRSNIDAEVAFQKVVDIQFGLIALFLASHPSQISSDNSMKE